MSFKYGADFQEVSTYWVDLGSDITVANAKGEINLKTFSKSNPYIYSYSCKAIDSSLKTNFKSLMGSHINLMFAVTEHMLQQASLTWQLFGVNVLLN